MPDEWLSSENCDRWYASLPNATGTFTGYYDSAVVEELFGPPPDLIPVELDTHDRPNPIADAPRGTVLTFTIGGRRWSFEISYIGHMTGNRWIAWCYRDSIREVADGQGPGPGPVL